MYACNNIAKFYTKKLLRQVTENYHHHHHHHHHHYHLSILCIPNVVERIKNPIPPTSKFYVTTKLTRDVAVTMQTLQSGVPTLRKPVLLPYDLQKCFFLRRDSPCGPGYPHCPGFTITLRRTHTHTHTMSTVPLDE
jgi:hypothetical protein